MWARNPMATMPNTRFDDTDFSRLNELSNAAAITGIEMVAIAT